MKILAILGEISQLNKVDFYSLKGLKYNLTLGVNYEKK